jgi:phosphohistidine phosphatase
MADMKELYIIRHAKSSWKQPGLNDFDRPLNNRGLKDAPRMASFLKSRGIIPDRMLLSPAVRTKQTAAYFKIIYEMDEMQVESVPELYHAYADTIFSQVSALDKEASSVFLFGHNPGLTYFVNTFKGAYIENLPTCGVCHIQFNIENWVDISPVNGTIVDFWFPKMIE